MHSLIKNTAIYMIGRMLPQITGFVLLPIYTKYLSPEEYGIVESMLVLGMVLSIFFSMATERSMFRLYYDYISEAEKKIFLGNIFILIVAFSTVVLFIIFLSKNLIAQIYSSINFKPYYVYAIINAYLMAFAFIPETLFQVKEKAINFFIITISSFFFGVGFILYYVVVLNQGAEGLLKGKMIGNLIMFPVYIYIIIKNSKIQIKKTVIMNILSFSLPMMPTLLTAWILNMSNRIFIEQYFSLKEVGIFSLAFKISTLVSVILGALFTAYNPTFYRLANQGDQLQSENKIKKINKSILIFALILCFGISFFSKELITIFLDKKYLEAAKIIPLIVLSNFMLQISAFYNLMIYQSKKSMIIMSISIIGAFFSVIFNFLLVPKYGIYGASWAAIITSFILLIIKNYYAKKNYYIPLPFKLIMVGSFTAIVIVSIDKYLDFSNLFLIFSIKIILTLIAFYFFFKKYFKNFKALIIN